MASVATIQLCCCDIKAATEDTERNVRGRVPVKLYLQKQAASHGLPTFSGGKVRERSGAFNTRLRSFLFPQ